MRSHAFPKPGASALGICAALVALAAACTWAEEVILSCPGLAPSRLDAQGRLQEDWGAVGITVSGKNAQASPTAVHAIQLDGVVPAAESKSKLGAIEVLVTAFRAPAFPAGLDVMTLTLKETANQEASARVAVELPGSVRIGSKTVSIGGRTVMALPEQSQATQEMRDWGWYDDAVSLPGWGRPAVPCDPAFQNIRAGMGGVPIAYRFAVKPKSAAVVVLGFCESHWPQAGQRPLVCQVEGANPQEIDPVAAWGQHHPGALQFSSRDLNGDGQLEIAVVTKPGSPDENPILNAIWIFPARTRLDLNEVIAGKRNNLATHFVDVGGAHDQSLFAGGKLEYKIRLAPGASSELTFLVACPGGSAPAPDRTAWTAAKLRKAAGDVCRQWAHR